MNYDAAIRELEEKRDYCIAAISVLTKLSMPAGKTVEARPTRGRRKGFKISAETRTRMSQAATRRMAQRRADREAETRQDASGNGTQPSSDAIQ